MQLKQKTVTRVAGCNEEAFLASASKPGKGKDYVALVQLVAQMCDMIAAGEDVYMIIGATSKKDSFSLTVKQNGDGTTVYATSLPDLSLQASTLL